MATGSYDFGYIPRDDYNYGPPSEAIVPGAPQYAPPPITEEEIFYSGLVNGVPTFTNMPERAQSQGLRRWVPSTPEREVTGLGTVMGKASDEELLNAMQKYKQADIAYTAENFERAQRYKEQVASAQAFEAGAPARQSEAMRSKILRWASANKIPAAEVAATMKNYGVGEVAKPEAPKRYEVGGALVDESGKVIYKAEPKVEKASIPRFGVSVEAAARAMGYESFADVPTGEEANRVMEEARRQQALGVSTKEEAKAGFRQPSSAERTALSDIETSINMLDSLDKMYKPEYTGPIAGRAGWMQSVTGIGLSPGEASFRAATATFRNQVIKAITGAQMSEPEAQRIRKQIPEENDPPEVWRAKRQEATRLLQETLATKKDILARGGYILGEARGETQPPAAATGGGIKAIASDADYDALPSGTTFIGPDGKQRRKP